MQLEQECLREERLEAARRFGEQLSELEQLRFELERERSALKAERKAWEEQVRSQRVAPTATAAAVAESAVGPAQEQSSDQDDSGRDHRPWSQTHAEFDLDRPTNEAEEAAQVEQDPVGEAAEEPADEEVADDQLVAQEVTEEEADQQEADQDAAAADRAADRATARNEANDALQSSADEQSIEEYMAALLNRTRGGKPAEAVIAPQPKRNKRKSDTSAARNNNRRRS